MQNFTAFQIQLMLMQMGIGALSTLAFKYQSKIQVNGETFNHPFNQVLFMFIGEALCYPLFYIYKKIKWRDYQKEMRLAKAKNLSTELNPLKVIILAGCDLITSCLAFSALQLMPSSVYSMVRGATLIVTGLFQVWFLKKKLYLYQGIGMGFILLGNFIVGISVYFFSHDNDTNSLMLIGILFLFLSFFTFSFQLILEEKYFGQYYLNPFQLVGLEGIWGVILTIILLAVLQYTPCPKFLEEGCPVNANGNYYFEQTDSFFRDLFAAGEKYQPQLALAVFAGMFSILLLNALSMAVTKYLSALTRNVVQVSTIVIVWVCSLSIGWEDFIWGQLIGFFILTFGSLIYGTIIQFSFAPVPERKSDSLLSKVESTTNDQVSIQEERQEQQYTNQ